MNNDSRKRINEAVELLNQAQEILQECHDEEEDYLNNMPENLYYSERHEIAEMAVDNLDSALSNIEDVINYAEEAAE